MAKDDHYAILVTITQYPGLSSLKGPEADGEALTQWLTSPDGGDIPLHNIKHIRSSDYSSVVDAYDANPTEIHLKKALDGLLREGKEREWKNRVGERLYLFFAGHGFTAGSSLTDPALFSAVAQSGDPAHIAGYRYASKIANAGFFEEIILFMDCCQDVLKSSQVLEPTWTPPDRNRSSQVKMLQAFGAPRGKKAFERDLDGNGVTRGLFTVVVLEALRTAVPSADADGWVTGYDFKKQFAQIWGKRFRDETNYDPPVRLPDGDDIRILRRPGPFVAAGSPSDGLMGDTILVDVTNLATVNKPLLHIRREGGFYNPIWDFAVTRGVLKPPRRLPTGMFTVETAGDANDLAFEVLPSEGTFQVGRIDFHEIPAQSVTVDPNQSYAVDVFAPDSVMQVKIYDADYNEVGSGCGSVSVQLHPGLYKAEVEAGGARSQEIFRISDQRIVLKLAPPLFPTAAPVNGSSTSHEYHSWPACDQALRQPAQTLPGADSELMVFVRVSAPELGTPLDLPHPWENLVIRDFSVSGYPLTAPLDFVDTYTFTAATKLALPAGVYALSSQQNGELESKPFGLALQTVPGWRTECYVDCIVETREEFGLRITLARPNFSEAAIHLVEIGQPALMHDELGTRTELARIRLATGRRSVIPGDQAVARSPMLGIYAAYAAYQRDPHDKSTIRQCLKALPVAVQAVTDVRLLLAWLEESRESLPPQPLDIPMLSLAWDLSRRLPLQSQLAPALRGLIGQWRIGGSMWSAWRRPLQITSSDAPGSPGYNGTSLDVYEVLARCEREQHGDTQSVALDPPWNLDYWTPQLASLRIPNPDSSPFQQALRRRLLDAIELSEELTDDEVFQLGAQYDLDTVWSAREYTAFSLQVAGNVASTTA